MQALFFWLAAGLALLTFAVHTFVGGVYVARPLLADRSLPKAAKWLNYYCWHITTVMIAALGCAFAYAAMEPSARDLAVFAIVLTALVAALSVAVALRAGINPLRFPSTSLFAATAAAGAAALLAG